MEKKDFERMAGCELTAMEWENARTIYKALPFDRWDALAGEWKEVRGTQLAQNCAEYVKWMDQKVREAVVEAIGRCGECNGVLSDAFARQFGVRTVIKLKCEESLPFTDSERDYIARSLV